MKLSFLYFFKKVKLKCVHRTAYYHRLVSILGDSSLSTTDSKSFFSSFMFPFPALSHHPYFLLLKEVIALFLFKVKKNKTKNPKMDIYYMINLLKSYYDSSDQHYNQLDIGYGSCGWTT